MTRRLIATTTALNSTLPVGYLVPPPAGTYRMTGTFDDASGNNYVTYTQTPPGWNADTCARMDPLDFTRRFNYYTPRSQGKSTHP